MTKANQVAPMLAMLRGLIPDATEAIGEFAKLAEYVDETEARATQAERDRDAWRAKWEALETTRAVCCDQMERERDEARATGRDNLAMWEVERDALKAKLAESTEWGSRACEVLGYVLGTLNLCDEQHWAFDPLNVEPVKDKAVAVRLLVRDLRAQLAKTERVVEAARQHLRCDLTDTESISAEHALQNALRALDSPVGVAATACDHKRQRCENDHAVCRDCGAVNRAVTGVVDWGPPETDRTDGSTGAVACPVCRCLKVGHHPGGCEGAGGNCGCTERFPEGRGRAVEKPDPQAPVTRAELDELRREVLETVADVCLRADDNAQAPWPWPLTRLGAELRRRVERLEGG